MVEENNEIYYLQYSILTDSIYINRFNINVKYRNKKYSYKIINDLITKYNLPIVLECWPTLIPFYKKLGFNYLYEDQILSTLYSGYVEMIKKI